MLAWLIALVLTLANPGHAIMMQPLDSAGGPPTLQAARKTSSPIPVTPSDSAGGPPTI